MLLLIAGYVKAKGSKRVNNRFFSTFCFLLSVLLAFFIFYMLLLERR